MKSSILRRSNLSKERMDALEALSKYNNDSSCDDSLNEYVRTSGKEKEIDLLWDNFNLNQKIKSPGVYLGTGFVAGAITMLALTTLFSFSAKSDEVKIEEKVPVQNEQINSTPTDSNVVKSPQTYTVKSGDTVESIMIKFYGSYSQEYAKAIQNVNNLSNVNKLQIGQKLIIPAK